MRQQPALGRRIPRKLTAHPYHSEQRVPQGWQGTAVAVRVRSCGSEASLVLKKVRRLWNVERQQSPHHRRFIGRRWWQYP